MSVGEFIAIGLSTLLFSVGSNLMPQGVTQRIAQVVPTTSSPSSNISRNWSGYTSMHGKFTGVQGNWIVPQVDGSSSFGADATWVGIGGVNTTDLIQAGTQALVDRNGQVHYEAFYEMLPDSSQPIQLTIHAGDEIAASVISTSNNTWKITVQNQTQHQLAEFTVPYASSFSSAEWIEEAPSGMRNTLPLDNFGTIQFKNAAAIHNGKVVKLSQTNPEAVTMGDRQGQLLATASSLDSDGSGFRVLRTDTPSAEDIQGEYDGENVPFSFLFHRFHHGR